jgi:glycosyltransferase involved in cell wall biosynthesis
MASGKPIVASNVGGNPEAIENEVTGFLFEPDKPDELAKQIILLLKNKTLRQKMGQAARDRALNLFSIRKMLDSYDEIYQSLLRNKHLLDVCGEL